MIYTITLNPSIDYLIEVENFELNKTNRTISEVRYPGGKGINVSLVLDYLGHKSVALGFVAGNVGKEIESMLSCIDLDFVCLNEGESRTNIKFKNIDGTEINGMGPTIKESELKLFYEKLSIINEDDVVVLAGSIPASLSKTMYNDILERLPNCMFVLDATGEVLLNSLKYRPFLIKPNIDELEEIFNTKINDDDLYTYAYKLQQMGARNVLISLGSKGAYLLDENCNVYTNPACKGKLVNSVGSGDSMVAGFIAGYLESNDYTFAFKKSIASGSASAFSEHFANKQMVDTLLKQL